MSSSDATSLSAASPDAANRLIALDKWLAARIEEANVAESRLGKRLEHMARAEEGLKALLESLRQQTAAAAPVANQLAEFRPAARAAAAEVLQSAQVMHARVIQQTRASVDAVHQSEQALAEGMADLERRAHAAIAPAEQAIWRAVHEAKTEAQSIALVLPQRIIDQINALNSAITQSIESATQRVNARIEVCENKAIDFEKWLDDQTRQTLQRVQAETRVQAESAEHLWQERIHKHMADHERRATSLCDLMQRKLDAYQKSTDDLAGLIERLLRQSMAAAQASADTRSRDLRCELDAVFTSLRAELQRSAQDFQKESAAALSQLQLALQRQLQQELDTLKAESHQRCQELHQTGRSIAEQVEEELVRRIRDLRPRFNRELETAEKLLGDRISHLATDLQSTVELRESQLTSRLEDLRPRAAAVYRSIEAELAAKSATLEHEANTMTSFLERRLSQRIDDLIQRTRRALHRTISQADAAINDPPTVQPTPTPEFQLFVDRAKLRPTADAPAQPTDTPKSASAA